MTKKRSYFSSSATLLERHTLNCCEFYSRSIPSDDDIQHELLDLSDDLSCPFEVKLVANMIYEYTEIEIDSSLNSVDAPTHLQPISVNDNSLKRWTTTSTERYMCSA